MRPTPAPPAAAASGLTGLDAHRIAAAVASGELRAADVVEAHLARIGAVDPGVRALVALDADAARHRADDLDRARSRGEQLGPLAGVPVAVKDNIDVRGQLTACGSHAHDGVPARRDATCVRRLRAAGAVLIARANMDEFAMGASTQTSAFGATRNPFDPQRSPGGSSGGSAAAVAARLVPLAVGTDTGGSIREPASQCGVVGMAPSSGLVPVDGVVPFAAALDRVGPMARSCTDTRLLLDVLAGRPPSRPVPDGRGLRVGLVADLQQRGNQPGVLDRFGVAVRALDAAGVDLVAVTIPDAAAGLAAYMAITAAACVPVLERAVRTGRAGAEVERRWLLGRDLLTGRRDELEAASALQEALVGQTAAALASCDVLLSPTMPTTAPLLQARTADHDDPSARDLADPMHAPYTDCWSVLANLTGLAALSVPAGRSPVDGMPVGVQFAGPAGSDDRLLALGALLESTGVDG